MSSWPTRTLLGLRKWKPLLYVRYRCEYAALFLFAWMIPRLPRAAVLRLAQGVGALAFFLDRRGRTLGHQNLATAIEQGGLCLGSRSPDAVLRECYQNFARGLIDLFWFTRLRADQLDRWLTIEGEAELVHSIRADRGAVFLTPHYGIFEWTSLAVGFRGVTLDIVAQDFRNAALNSVFGRAREHTGHRIVSRQGAMLRLMRTARSGGNIALLPDLNVPPQGAAVPINVFGVPAWMTAVHVEISRRCDVPMFVAVCEPQPDGRAILRVLDIIHAGGANSHLSRAEVTQMVWDRFESAVRNRPELWLWMYRHWRYQVTEQSYQDSEAWTNASADSATGREARKAARQVA